MLDGMAEASGRGQKKSSGELADLYLRFWRARAETVFVALDIEAADRDDIAQDCFLACFSRRSVVENPEAYYLQTVRARCIDRLRSKSRRSFVALETAATLSTSAADPCDRIDVNRWLERLDDDERRLVIDRVVVGKDNRELAAEEGILPASVSRKLLRGMNKLRRFARR